MKKQDVPSAEPENNAVPCKFGFIIESEEWFEALKLAFERGVNAKR